MRLTATFISPLAICFYDGEIDIESGDFGVSSEASNLFIAEPRQLIAIPHNSLSRQSPGEPDFSPIRKPGLTSR